MKSQVPGECFSVPAERIQIKMNSDLGGKAGIVLKVEWVYIWISSDVVLGLKF